LESLLNLKRPFETRVELYCPGVFQRRRDDAAESCATAEQEAAMSLEEWLRHKSGSQVGYTEREREEMGTGNGP
jgi:hypothetical protein